MRWPKFLIRCKSIKDLPENCLLMCRMAPNMPFMYALKRDQVFWWLESTGIKAGKPTSVDKNTPFKYTDIYMLSEENTPSR